MRRNNVLIAVFILALFAGCSTPTAPSVSLVNTYSGPLGDDPIIVYIPEILGNTDSSFVEVYYKLAGDPNWWSVTDGDYTAYYYGIWWNDGTVSLHGFSLTNGFDSADSYLIQVFTQD